MKISYSDAASKWDNMSPFDDEDTERTEPEEPEEDIDGGDFV